MEKSRHFNFGDYHILKVYSPKEWTGFINEPAEVSLSYIVE